MQGKFLEELSVGQSAQLVRTVGEADILDGEAHHAPGDVERVLAARQHPGEPIERRVGVGAAQRLVQRADEVVVPFLRLVVKRRAALHGGDQRRSVQGRGG